MGSKLIEPMQLGSTRLDWTRGVFSTIPVPHTQPWGLGKGAYVKSLSKIAQFSRFKKNLDLTYKVGPPDPVMNGEPL